MESDGISLVIVLCILVIMSAYFSATETAFENFNKIRIKNLANLGNKKAKLVIKLDEDDDKLFSTTFIGNIISIITVASFATIVFSRYFINGEVTISIIVTTLVIIIFGEIFPKSIAKKAPEHVAMLSAPLIRVFIIILYPFNMFFYFWKKVFDKLFSFDNQPSMTEEELKSMIEEVESEGVINKDKSDLIRSAIEFNDVDVEDIFTPRIDIMAIEEHDSLEKIKEAFLLSGFSRIPIYQDSIDHIIGVIHEKDFYQALNRNEHDFKKLISDVLYVTPNKKISELLRNLQLAKAHMAIVIDEYGGTAGLVTMEDIIEELVGEIWDEHDEVVEWFKKVDTNKYLISCTADIDDMFDLFGMEIDDELEVYTVNGWLTKIFEQIPCVGDKITYENLNITVTQAEVKRVLEISVERIPLHCDINA